MNEADCRVGKQVYHTGQGKDKRARTRPRHLLRGLDWAWSVASNPHRESGTRWRAAADVGATGTSQGKAHGRQMGHDGNRLGDSVGAYSGCTGEGTRSVEIDQGGATGRSCLDSGCVLTGRMHQLRCFTLPGL